MTTIGVITINSRITTDFTWPLQAAEHFNYNDYWAISGFLDNNPTYGNIVDYNCGMRTQKDDVITSEMIDVRRPGTGLAPKYFDDFGDSIKLC